MVSAIVLAAGDSTRMDSENKLLMKYADKTLVEQVVDNVIACAAAEVIVVLGHQADKIRETLNDRSVRFLVNQNFKHGMTTSIHTGVQAASNEADGYMICLSDQPFILPQEFTRLILTFEGALAKPGRDIIIPVYQGQRGNPVIFSSKFRNDILAHKGLKGCKGIIKENPDAVSEVEMTTQNILTDIDTVDDYKTLIEQNE